MKTNITTLILFLFIGFSTVSQENNQSRKKIRSLKIAYLTEQLALTSSEAEKFWPIYNVFDKTQHQLREKNRFELQKVLRNTSSVSSIDEKEAQRLIEFKLANDKALFESEKEFIDKISTIIPYSKIIKLQMAEMDFNRKLLKKFHQRE